MLKDREQNYRFMVREDFPHLEPRRKRAAKKQRRPIKMKCHCPGMLDNHVHTLANYDAEAELEVGTKSSVQRSVLLWTAAQAFAGDSKKDVLAKQLGSTALAGSFLGTCRHQELPAGEYAFWPRGPAGLPAVIQSPQDWQWKPTDVGAGVVVKTYIRQLDECLDRTLTLYFPAISNMNLVSVVKQWKPFLPKESARGH